jgi:hypothetical protein
MADTDDVVLPDLKSHHSCVVLHLRTVELIKVMVDNSNKVHDLVPLGVVDHYGNVYLYKNEDQ